MLSGTSNQTLFHAFGIPVRPSFTLLLPFTLLSLQFGAWGLVAGVLLFTSVLLHELGHALVARRFGFQTNAIHLHMLGGVAMMRDMPKVPRQEVLIAVAGPVVSLALAATFGLLALLFGSSLSGAGLRWVDLLAYAGVVNLGMAIFNLVPALPMDGGRILRAVWAHYRGWLPATRAAGKVSRGFAIVFIAVGLFYGAWSLALIGALLFFMVKGEERAAELRFQPQPTAPLVWLRGPYGWVLVRADR